MPISRQKRLEIEQRRSQVVELYLRGFTQAAIGGQLGVDQATVSLDLAAVRQRWAEGNGERLAEWRNRELARIDAIEAEHWAAWRRSQRPRRATRAGTPYPEGGGPDGQPAPSNQEASVEEGTRAGDPRFLAGVQWCVEARCKVLGLAEHNRIDRLIELRRLATPEQVGELFDAVTEVVLANVTDLEARRRIGQGIGRLIAERRAAAGGDSALPPLPAGDPPTRGDPLDAL
jgi:hypothetical protein